MLNDKEFKKYVKLLFEFLKSLGIKSITIIPTLNNDFIIKKEYKK